MSRKRCQLVHLWLPTRDGVQYTTSKRPIHTPALPNPLDPVQQYLLMLHLCQFPPISCMFPCKKHEHQDCSAHSSDWNKLSAVTNFGLITVTKLILEWTFSSFPFKSHQTTMTMEPSMSREKKEAVLMVVSNSCLEASAIKRVNSFPAL